MSESLQAAALALAARGWRVVPLHHIDGGKCSCGDGDCKPGKHPRTSHGSKDGSADPEQIRRWWARWPHANVAVCMGPESGIFMVGPDGQEGLDALARLQAEHGDLPPTPTVRSGSGGKHYYFRWPAGAIIGNPKNHRGLPIDVRGAGGYAVAPPSSNLAGPYSWELAPEDVQVAEAPAWLVEWCQPVSKPTPPPARPAGSNGHSNAGSVVDRAVAYLNKMPPAVSGQGGHDRTMEAARVVVYGFDLRAEQGYQILAQHYNPRCVPEWSERELRHKCEDADTTPFGKERGWLLKEQRPLSGGGRGNHATNGQVDAPAAVPRRPVGCLRNFDLKKVKRGDKEETVKVGRASAQIAGDVLAASDGWPKRIEHRLFATEDYRPLWLETTDALFAWIERQFAGDDGHKIHWAGGEDKVTKAEFGAYLRQTVERYEAVEGVPHYPPLAGCYYLHPEPGGGDGSALDQLVKRFEPSTLVDGDLIRALFLSAFWGGPPGQRPAWLVESEDDDGKGGRGVGKSKLAQAVADLAGGHIDARPNEDIDKLMTRLLSPAAMDRRVALLDNVKTLKFSWGDLEALITADVISGRCLYVGEGRRPNTLVWLITLNQASMSRDMAQRCIPVRLKRPRHDPAWEADTWSLINSCRWEIIGDVLTELRRPVPKLERYSRWSAWEQAVLAHVAEPSECQRVIEDRQSSIDGDQAEADLMREAFVAEIRQRGYCHETHVLWIPAELAAELVNRLTGEHKAANRASTYLRTLPIAELRKCDGGGRRGWTWRGKASAADATLTDITTGQSPW